MKREKVEQYIGKKVEVKLFDGCIFEGYLRKTHDESFKDVPNLYLKTNYYFLTSCENSKDSVGNTIFRATHITTMKLL